MSAETVATSDELSRAFFWAAKSCRTTPYTIIVEATGAVYPTGDPTPEGFRAALLRAWRSERG